MYDLRSDTFTKPTIGMREAMAQAPVGDDVYREDPTVNQLEEVAASLTGKERSLFVTSGSMGNLIPLYLHAGRGTEVLAHEDSHIIAHEIGAISAIAGTMPVALHTPRGLLDADQLEASIKPKAYDLARTAMIEVENTIGGVCYPLETLKDIYELAKKHRINVHMDGARLWNASVATGIPIRELASNADTVTFCLSKGLGAPVGSMLCGSARFIEDALVVRKMLGGGMRQAGILAAAGLYALEHHVERLADDHEHAWNIAMALSETSWAHVSLDDVQTNMVFFSVPGCSAAKIVPVFKRHGILCSGGGNRIRLVTHLDISHDDIEQICSILHHMDPAEFNC